VAHRRSRVPTSECNLQLSVPSQQTTLHTPSHNSAQRSSRCKGRRSLRVRTVSSAFPLRAQLALQATTVMSPSAGRHERPRQRLRYGSATQRPPARHCVAGNSRPTPKRRPTGALHRRQTRTCHDAQYPGGGGQRALPPALMDTVPYSGSTVPSCLSTVENAECMPLHWVPCHPQRGTRHVGPASQQDAAGLHTKPTACRCVPADLTSRGHSVPCPACPVTGSHANVVALGTWDRPASRTPPVSTPSQLHAAARPQTSRPAGTACHALHAL
jgi:hypothetical protein